MTRNLYPLIAIALLVVACGGEKEIDLPPTANGLVLTASKTMIDGGGKDTITFKVALDGELVTTNPGCVISATQDSSAKVVALQQARFVGDSIGAYDFTASYKGIRSNVVKVNVNVPLTQYARNHCVFYTTSVSCAACPTGSSIVQKAKAQYAPRILPLYFHGNFGGDKDPFHIGITSQVQMWLYGIGFPTISVNNQGVLANGHFGIEAFDPFIAAPALSCNSAVTIKTKFDGESRKLTCDFRALITNPIYRGEEIRIAAFVLEEDLSAPQLTPDNVDKNYVHHDVVRKPLIGTSIFGETIRQDYIASHQEYTKNIVFDMPAQWDVEKSYVQAYLLHKQGGETTKGDTVINVCRVKIGESADYELAK